MCTTWWKSKDPNSLISLLQCFLIPFGSKGLLGSPPLQKAGMPMCTHLVHSQISAISASPELINRKKFICLWPNISLGCPTVDSSHHSWGIQCCVSSWSRQAQHLPSLHSGQHKTHQAPTAGPELAGYTLLGRCLGPGSKLICWQQASPSPSLSLNTETLTPKPICGGNYASNPILFPINSSEFKQGLLLLFAIKNPERTFLV